MIDMLVTITILHWVVLLTPGVNFVLIAQLASSDDRSIAVAAVFGITSATLTWAIVAIAGVGSIFVTHPTIRQIAQIAGGAYLLYVAAKLWRPSLSPLASHNTKLVPASAFRLGYLTNILNPKPALFFGSIFVAALPANVGVYGLACAVALVYVNALLWHLLLVVIFSTPSVKLGFERFGKMSSQVAGVLVGVVAVKLIWAAAQEMQGLSATYR